MLIYEPPNTPEGDLGKRAMFRLKQIRSAIEKQQKLLKKEGQRCNKKLQQNIRKTK